MSNKAICFVDMPFGKKPDLASGVEVDFDHIYEAAIRPAIEEAGLEPVRGDQERTGGIIQIPMFGRLLLSEYVVVDMTLANPNVFYEMGIRHTAKPYTTVPIFAAIHNIPFDVALVRSIPYNLDKGHLTDEDASKLKEAILARLKEAINGPTSKDSPIFQLIPSFPAIDLPHEVTEIFQDQVRHCDDFRDRLAQARTKPSDQEREAALFGIEQSLGNLKVAQATVLVDLMLSYRDASAWGRMIALSDNFPDSLKANVMVRQQRALALNRRNQPVDRDQALSIIEKLVKEKGGDPETFGILGRIHKDRYKELKQKGSIMAEAALDDAIDAYRKGFESDPRDYYPGVNAVTLLIQKGGEDALKEAQRLAPMVSFAVARRGGASSSDYWDLATVLELSVIGEDWKMAVRVLPKVMASAKAAWMIQTTLDNLLLVKAVRDTAELNGIIPELQARFEELNG
ncbi:MAG: TRAFs-binding domain-containing protein [Proteobacteria bacterium]|nr:TRAFs-binding domain-containing protein [Pseudomonadota bacterium]